MKTWVDYVGEMTVYDVYIGKVFYQRFGSGDIALFKPTEKLKNGRYAGISATIEYGRRAKPKTKKITSEMPHFWKEVTDPEMVNSLPSDFKIEK
jgi:hypothetical protein